MHRYAPFGVDTTGLKNSAYRANTKDLCPHIRPQLVCHLYTLQYIETSYRTTNHDSENRKRTIKKVYLVHKFKMTLTQQEKIIKNMYKGERSEIHKNITSFSVPFLHSKGVPKSSPFSPRSSYQLNFPSHTRQLLLRINTS